jgi:hypothetical protein
MKAESCPVARTDSGATSRSTAASRNRGSRAEPPSSMGYPRRHSEFRGCDSSAFRPQSRVVLLAPEENGGRTCTRSDDRLDLFRSRLESCALAADEVLRFVLGDREGVDHADVRFDHKRQHPFPSTTCCSIRYGGFGTTRSRTKSLSRSRAAARLPTRPRFRDRRSPRRARVHRHHLRTRRPS